MTIRDLGVKFGTTANLQLGDDPGDYEDRCQAIELTRHILRKIDGSGQRALYDLTILRGDDDRGEDLSFCGMTPTECRRLGQLLMQLADEELPARAEPF